MSEKYNCECGSKILMKNKNKHMKSKKHIKFIDKKINNKYFEQ